MWSVSKLFGANRNGPTSAQGAATSPLTATAYDEQYYREHADAGLDYLVHGFWHESYAAMVSEASLQSAYPDPCVVDAGCACGSILKGFKNTGLFERVLGVDLSEHMIVLGRKHFRYADDELVAGSIAEIPAESGSVSLLHPLRFLSTFRRTRRRCSRRVRQGVATRRTCISVSRRHAGRRDKGTVMGIQPTLTSSRFCTGPGSFKSGDCCSTSRLTIASRVPRGVRPPEIRVRSSNPTRTGAPWTLIRAG